MFRMDDFVEQMEKNDRISDGVELIRQVMQQMIDDWNNDRSLMNVLKLVNWANETGLVPLESLYAAVFISNGDFILSQHHRQQARNFLCKNLKAGRGMNPDTDFS